MSSGAWVFAVIVGGGMATYCDVSYELVEMQGGRGGVRYLRLALFQWAWLEVGAGRWDQAEWLLTEGLAVNRQIGDQGNEPIFPAALTWIARAQGQYGRSIELGRRAIELSSGVGHPEFLSWAAGVLG